MKDKLNKIFDISFPIYVILNMVYIFFGSYLIIKRYISIRLFSYGYIALLIINLIIIFMIFFMKKYKKNKIDIFLILIIIFAIISTIFAFNKTKALFGEWGRHEGLFVICYYMTIVFIASFLKKEDRVLIVYSFLVVGFIECIYAICQKLDLFNVITYMHKGKKWATGFINNPNFFGTLMLLCISSSIGLYIDSNSKKRSTFYYIITLILFVGLLFSDTLSVIVGLAAIMLFLFIYCIKFNIIKKYLCLIISMAIILLCINYFNLSTVVVDVVKTKNESTNIVKGDLSDNYGTGRMKVWKESIKVVPKYIVHGVGIDNFSNVLNGKSIHDKKHLFDKAHNEYLQILITMGIFSLISYLCLHFIIIKNGIKNSLKNKEIYLLLPVIGYIVQAQFNISVIEVAPIFYIGLGLLVER